MFRVGQKVVCVDDEWRVSRKKRGWLARFRSFKKLPHNLTRNEVYTVTGVSQVRDAVTGQIFECIFVAGAWHLFGHSDIPFPAFQFCELLERKTDISVFTKMLTGENVDA